MPEAVPSIMQPVRVTPPDFACVVAADEARGIGRDNHLPWPRLRADGAHLKYITTATGWSPQTAGKPRTKAVNAVIMGRRTWESIPPRYRPLPGRLNIVVSRTTPALPESVSRQGSLDEALAAAVTAGVETIYVLGGGQLFDIAVRDPRCRLIYYTRIAARFDADVFFPGFEREFVRLDVSRPHHEAGVHYQIELWQRR